MQGLSPLRALERATWGLRVPCAPPTQLGRPVLRTWSCPSGLALSQAALPAPKPTSSPASPAARGSRGASPPAGDKETPRQLSWEPGPREWDQTQMSVL